MDSTDLKEIHEFITELWRFIKETYAIQNTDSYWQNVINKADEIAKKHDNNTKPYRLAKKLVLAYVDFLESEVSE